MQEQVYDFRSDTVTKPTGEMKQAMSRAPVGDDAFSEDPTTNALQEKVAEMTGFEAALFVPSGSMGNLTALMCHTRPGQILYSGRMSHIKIYELGGYARIAGLNLIEIDDSQEGLDLEALKEAWSPGSYMLPVPGIVTVENTQNMLGGMIYSEQKLAELAVFTRDKGVPLHMDGARLWHAAQALGQPLTHWTRHVDSVMLCLSKGLGAPVGSVLAGSKAFIQSALSIRKLLGGGMRQSGVLAAAGLHAIEHHLPELGSDHARCQQVAEELADLPWLQVTPPQTNILIVRVTQGDAADFVSDMQERGILFFAVAQDRIRIVFHRDLSEQACQALVAAIKGWGASR